MRVDSSLSFIISRSKYRRKLDFSVPRQTFLQRFQLSRFGGRKPSIFNPGSGLLFFAKLTNFSNCTALSVQFSVYDQYCLHLVFYLCFNCVKLDNSGIFGKLPFLEYLGLESLHSPSIVLTSGTISRLHERHGTV